MFGTMLKSASAVAMMMAALTASSTSCLANNLSYEAHKKAVVLTASQLMRQDHPLVDTIWDVKAGKQITQDELIARLAKVTHVLVGERHNNPRHHDIQALIIDGLAKQGRQPFVLFEHISSEFLPVTSDLKKDDVAGLGEKLEWKKRGWPAWSMFQPIFDTIVENNLKVVPAGPTFKLLMQVGHGGAPSEKVAAQLQWDREYSKEQEEDLLDELEMSHCGKLKRISLGPLVWMQRLKDSSMGYFSRISATNDHGSVVIAGSGHVRKDRGIPWWINDGSSKLTVAAHEVNHKLNNPDQYSNFDPDQFDFIWFTGRVDEDDACEKFKEQLEKAGDKFNHSDEK